MVPADPSERRRILCTSCDGDLEIAAVAKSVNCVHCHTRVVTEAMDVDGYIAVRRFATANRLRIRRKGKVFASVRADDLEVDGFLQGEAVALRTARFSKTAEVRGSVRAPSLVVEPGARLSGDLRIGPSHLLPPSP